MSRKEKKIVPDEILIPTGNHKSGEKLRRKVKWLAARFQSVWQ